MASNNELPYTQEDGFNGEKDTKPKDSDNSSGNIENLENGPAADAEAVDLAIERAILRKLDYRIVPMVMWCYLMNMMDRVNIGNARLFDMEEDLGMQQDGMFQLAVSVLFITYCLFEAPSNMIIKRLQPARYLAGLTICWGLIATFSAFVNNFAALIACRLLLGLFEAGFFPGVVLYLSMFYGRRSLALRIAYFYSTAALSGVAGGLVAYGISFMHGYAGWSAWRWIILINGIPTVVTGCIIPFVLPNSPETAKFLTDEDRANLQRIHEAQVGRARNLKHLVKEDVWDAVKDWTTWAYCFALFPQLAMLYSFVVFLPTIIRQMGTWNNAETQAMTVPVYAVGAIVYITCARLSDVTQRRGYFVMGGLVSALVGYGMLISNQGPAVSYAGTFFVSIGIFTTAGISFAWVPTNNPRYGKRAFSTGMHLSIGNSSGVASPFLFSNEHAPAFTPGYAGSMGMLGVSLILNVILHLHFKRQNKLRDEGKQDYLMEGKTDIEIEAMGEKSPRFRFAI
ncbi:high-affinity nicotinic acid transporter [Sodiomyces alkalinus F11]|uniref:High-affinity nicotinic acid transporter n=1 Tax=Sodiomyces alkalinus (strain CBS 110278 / VKM F-3762 / F11) TaxID=1314773 RepID=A0A3N2PWZ0_SODAK|nr:high-affinity nicotinic acid transporter [Sodiomyces alkalinus F11]ROT39004.1 high-affinity nicotinic acid transporter [Sodiomyces alkalinus F11]